MNKYNGGDQNGGPKAPSKEVIWARFSTYFIATVVLAIILAISFMMAQSPSETESMFEAIIESCAESKSC